MTIVLAQELQPGDRFDAIPFVEAEIERAYEAGEAIDEGWADSLRVAAANEYFEVDNVETDDPDGEWVVVWAYPQNIMIRFDEEVELANC